MSHAEYENLSAMVDGELGSDQFAFMLRRVQGNPVLRDAWDRYHIVGASLRRELPELADGALSERIMDRIATPAAPMGRRRGSHRWLRWSAGGAIAASVAVAALVVMQPQGHHGSQATGTTVATQPTVSVPHDTMASATATRSMTTTPEVPRWLSASPTAGMAQPAAATFTPLGRRIGDADSASSYHARARAPYMSLPHADSGRRARADQQARWWPSAHARRQSSHPLQRQRR